MKKIEKQVLQTKSFFVAKDGKEFDTYGCCIEHEYELALNDASKFDFKWKNDDEEIFTAIYHSNMKKAFAEDLNIILNYRFDLGSTNQFHNYDTSNILEKFKKVLGCELIDGHEYSFVCDYCYADGDHADDFYLYITDITERNRVQNSIPECRKTILENQTACDFIELAKHQVNVFGSATVKIIFDELIEKICNEQH